MPSKKLPVLSPIKAWSFSRYSTYSQCPLKLKLSAVDRIQEPPSAPMERGARIGKLAEDYVKGNIGAKLPAELKAFAAEFRAVRKLFAKEPKRVVCEDTWALDKAWARSQWDAWATCWVRIKLDLAVITGDEMLVTDWKTGKYRPQQQVAYLEQLELYALGALILHPNLKKVRVRLGFLDAAIFHPPAGEETVYTQADVPKLKKLWLKRVTPLLSDTIFSPRPNQYCSFCFYRKDNKANGGGQCPI